MTSTYASKIRKSSLTPAPAPHPRIAPRTAASGRAWNFTATPARGARHVDGPEPGAAPQHQPAKPITPCPTSVSIGALTQRNHASQSEADKLKMRTYLGAMSKMNVGPGEDHSGHCMKESLTLVSNDCPAKMYQRDGENETQPCSGNRCLDINRPIASWGQSDGPNSFLDMHRTQSPQSLLEDTGVDSCKVVCEQTYKCDRKSATTGKFLITRNFKAGTYTPKGGNPVHITTGTVEKTDAAPAPAAAAPTPDHPGR